MRSEGLILPASLPEILIYPDDAEVKEIVLSRAGQAAFRDRRSFEYTVNQAGLKLRIAVLQAGAGVVETIQLYCSASTNSRLPAGCRWQ